MKYQDLEETAFLKIWESAAIVRMHRGIQQILSVLDLKFRKVLVAIYKEEVLFFYP